ncbi:MAG: acyltransferase [Pirellulales bacterium]
MTDRPPPSDGSDLQPGATRAPSRLAALDGLRGLAVLFVLLSHASKHFPVLHPMFNFRGAGKFGVYLFFLLSAYLLDRQIALAMRHGEQDYWGNYFLRRVLRVYPLFTVALVLHLLLTRLGITTVIETWQDVAAHLTLREGKGVFWSIPVEMTYDLVSPVILLLTLGVSFLTYSCIEKPLARIRLADLWRSGRNRDAVDDLSHVRTKADHAPVREGKAVESQDRRG